MRKITSLLMLFCAFVGTAFAEVNSELISKKITIGADATSITEGKWYVLYNHGKGLCVSEETSAFRMRTVPANDAVAELNAGKLFKFVAVEDQEGQYYIVSGNGLYFDFVNNNSSTVSNNPVAYKVAQIGENAGHFYIQHVGNSYIADGQGNGENFVCWEKTVPGSVGGNNCYHFKPVTLEDVVLYDVTYNYYVGEELKHTEVVEKQVEGASVSAPTFGYVTFTAPTGTISAENYIFNIDCELEETPITFSADLNNPTWQIVEMHRGFGDRFWFYNASSKQVNVNNWATPYNVVNEAYWWCFVGDQFGFKIYNKAAGTEVTLNATSGAPTVGVASNGNDNWILVKSSYADYQEIVNTTVCFTHDRTNYMNHQGGVAKYWTSNDNGSTCFIHELSGKMKSATDALYAEISSDNTAIDGYVGTYGATAEQIEALNECNNAEPFNIANAKDLIDEILATKVELVPGYYYVKGTGVGNGADWYLTHKINEDAYNTEKKECLWAEAPTGKLNADFIWKFETCEDGYKIQSVNLGKYFQIKVAANSSDNNTYIVQDYEQGNKFLLTDNGAGKFIIKNGNGQNVRTENGGQVNSWSTEGNESWYLIPATELEIDLNEVNGKFYSTGYYPFAVSTDANTTAFVAATGEGVLNMSPVEGAVPAETGVVFESTEAVATLTIGDEAAPVTSVLSGTLTEIAANGSLVLNAANGVLGFYALNAEQTIGANKAFYTAPAPAVALNFGGNTTAIESVVNGLDLNAPIYDLSGRRVNNATKGIYIQNGKKFIVK